MSEQEQNQGTPLGSLPEQEPQQKTSPPPPPERNRPSSVYVYLAVLFGAAFLMLLLAYFVQQRNNATAMDDLRTTTNASRAELLENIQRLEEDAAKLREEKESLTTQLSELKSELFEAYTTRAELVGVYNQYVNYTSILHVLYASEVMLAEGDATGAARELAGIQYSDFVDTIDRYDAEPFHKTEAMPLRPRFDALVSTLREQGALEEGWAMPGYGSGEENG